jgi:hypothetical protein
MSKPLTIFSCPGRSAAPFGDALQNRDHRDLERSRISGAALRAAPRPGQGQRE